VSKGEKTASRRILLVDDVLTTGATAGACARAMKRAGAVTVTVLTVARADRRVWVQQAEPAASFAGAAEKPFGSLIDGESGSIA
jgi:adenine/guanine phosphoribosyltransferase-like PRPP-binding protein